jgi:hypothetical protein
LIDAYNEPVRASSPQSTFGSSAQLMSVGFSRSVRVTSAVVPILPKAHTSVVGFYM